MRLRKAVITAAGRNQRTLPLQTFIDRDGAEKSVLRIIIQEVLSAKIEEICVIISWFQDVYVARGTRVALEVFKSALDRLSVPVPG